MHRLNIIKVLLCLRNQRFWLLPSCVEDIPEEFMFTSTKTMDQYEDEPDLSEFTAILERVKHSVYKAYGLSVLLQAPAIEKYYEAKANLL